MQSCMSILLSLWGYTDCTLHNHIHTCICAVYLVYIYSCQRVPSGPCHSKQLAETGYYFSAFGQDATAVLEVVAPSESNTSSLSSCQISLLKLACDYYYPPCDPMTFQQRAICDASCEIVSLIQTICPSKIENSSVLNEILRLDCSDPSSYLVKNVTVSQDQCIDLSAYGKLQALITVH